MTIKKNNKWKIYGFILLIYILVFQDVIQKYIPIFKYFDELLAISIFPLFVIKNGRNTIIKKDTLTIIVLLSIILIVGLYSNITYKYQSTEMILNDIIVIFKFFMVYFFSNLLLDEEFIKNNRSKILFHIKMMIYLLFILTLLNFAFQIFPSYDYRLGIMTNKLFYGHQTYLVAICIFLTAMLILCANKIPKKEIIFLLIILLSTLRVKAIGATAVIVFLIIYVFKNKRKITISKFFIMGVICFILAYNQLELYFVKFEDSARNQLLTKSLQIMKDYFPVGTGFATYGSYFSAVSYSPVYYIYELDNVFGLHKDEASFVSDSFWPMIFGQFGIIGSACYVWIIIIIFKKIQNSFSKDSLQLYVSQLICLAYLLISSTSESAFSNSIAIPLAIILGIKHKEKS